MGRIEFEWLLTLLSWNSFQPPLQLLNDRSQKLDIRQVVGGLSQSDQGYGFGEPYSFRPASRMQWLKFSSAQSSTAMRVDPRSSRSAYKIDAKEEKAYGA